MDEEEDNGKRDTCGDVDLEHMNAIDSINTAKLQRPREDDGELNPNTLDAGFFADFSVDGRLWDVWDKIDTKGFVYIHQESGRPLAIANTLDRNTNELNGYCFWFQFKIGKLDEISYPLSKSSEIKPFLEALDRDYTLFGNWLNDIRVGNEKSVPNTEKEDEIEHTTLYKLFLNEIGVSRVEHEKREKILTAKRHLNKDNASEIMLVDCNK